MDDIARHVGLSRTTVSFVINGRTDMNISEESRKRVWDAVRDLGYRPDAGARSLAARRTDLIGVVTDITTSPFGGGIVQGAQDAAWRQGKLLLIVGTDGDPGVEAAAVDMLLERRVEGMIYATLAHREVAVPKAMTEVPTVLVHCFDGALPHVLPDEAEGGRTGTRRLIDAGHRRIGLINLDPAVPAAVGRRAGYERALAEAGIPVDPRLIVSGDATATSGFERAAELLDLDDPPTGLFCCTDRMAMGAYDAVRERGLRVPQDIGVVGYDNQEIIAAYLRPPLTTVALPFDEMGAAAVAMLTDPDGPGAGRTIGCPLVERASV
ncbi:LacI family DNA-binding transcriptional regulator [Actinokineospora soli]